VTQLSTTSEYGVLGVRDVDIALERLPPSPDLAELVELVERHRVEDVVERFGIAPRTLQRLFARYVGVSPKWVLRRYRLHEAAARLAAEQDRTWAEVAAELGYFDQSHFIRDFTAAIGLTPVAYAQACRTQQEPISA
jgi:AraC-like DNA-binding protein